MVLKLRKIWLICIFALLSATISACGSSGDGDSTENKTTKWQEDIEYFEKTLASNHPNLFWNISREQYRKQIDRLYDAAPDLEEYEIVLELARITSMMATHKDDHTAIWIWNMQKYIKFFPISVRWFSDGVYVIHADAAYPQIFEQKLVSIENTAIEDVLDAVSEYISHGNDMWLLEMAPSYIMTSELLYMLGIIENRAFATFHFQDASGEEFSVKVPASDQEPLVMFDRHPGSSTPDMLPAYRRNVEKYYWFEYLPEDKVVYVAYNSCENMKEQTFEQFTDEVITFIDGHETNKLIFDLRNNYGGDSRILIPFMEVLVQHPDLNAEGKLFVPIGRGTFSSGTMACQDIEYATENALFIGEPSGGLVDDGVFGDISASFSLPNSGLPVTCSATYFDFYHQDESMASFIPDVDISESSEDYFGGRDLVLDYILKEYPE